MRVIAGSRRSLPLKAPAGSDTRPTEDRTKETLFNVLANDIYDGDFLDLFSGSGGIAIEALSRGCEAAVLVEKDQKALSCIAQNLKFTKFTEQAQVLSEDVFIALKKLQGHPPFSVVFMDPPYRAGLERQLLEALSSADFVDEYTIVVIEALLSTDVSFAEDLGFHIYKTKNYKTNKHIFLQRK